MNITTIVTHAGCADGMASLILASDVYPEAKVIALYPGSKEHKELEAVPGMLFCDFSPPRDRVEEFIEAGSYVYDHHDSAKDITQRFQALGRGWYGGTEEGESGASIVYKKVWEPSRKRYEGIIKGGLIRDCPEVRAAKELSELAAIRDTWQTKDARWDKACTQGHLLRWYPLDHWVRHGVIITKEEWKIGEIVQKKHNKTVEHLIQTAYRTELGGLKVGIFSASSQLTSDISEGLRKEGINITAGFSYIVEGNVPKVCYSIRSDDKFNCSEFCSYYGGGGHKLAGGMNKVVFDEGKDPYSLIIDLLEEWLLK